MVESTQGSPSDGLSATPDYVPPPPGVPRHVQKKDSAARSDSQVVRRRGRRSIDILHIVAVLLVILLVAYISASDGVDYIHGFGKACLVIHDGWHFHMQCGGSVSPPKP